MTFPLSVPITPILKRNMRNLHLFTFLLLSLMSLQAYGQSGSLYEDANRDVRGRISRGPYETAAFGDNIWIGVAGGVNLFEHSYVSAGNLTPALDINVGKWVTPCVGVRIGYQGITISSGYSVNEMSAVNPRSGHSYFHGDLLWNVSNVLSGYKETRRWNFIPFVSTGLAHSCNGGQSADVLGIAAGLLNEIRITDRIGLSLEVRQLLVCGNYDFSSDFGFSGVTSATFGILFRFGKTGFRRCDSSVYESRLSSMEAARDALYSRNVRLDKMNSRLVAQNDELRSEIDSLTSASRGYAGAESAAQGVFFFEAEQSVLSEQELFHLASYVRNMLAANPDKIFTVIGYTDSGMLQEASNPYLAGKRAEYVCDLLRTSYGIPQDRVIMMSAGADDRWGSALLNRCVIIE